MVKPKKYYIMFFNQLITGRTIILHVYRFEIAYIKHLINVRRKERENKEKSGCSYDVFVSY
jgi:hypothetical protein